MKKMVVAGIFGIVVLVMLIFLITSNSAVTTPDRAVTTFYESWFQGKFMLSDGSYQNADQLSLNFKKKIDSIVSSFSSEGYDPIVCAQDIPNNFEVLPIATNGENAEVSVREYFDTIVKDIKISLARENALWKITDVICGDMPKTDIMTATQFEKEGNIVQKNGEWLFVYEEPGKPALTTTLDFSNWQCESDNNQCTPSFEDGKRAKITGKKINENTILVDLLTEL